MGLRKKRAKKFTQETEYAADEIKQVDLFSTKTVETQLAIECMRDPEDAPIKIGAKVKLLDLRHRIDVFLRLKSMGYVIGDAAAVRATLRLDQRRGHAIHGVVIEVSDLTPTFVVAVKE